MSSRTKAHQQYVHPATGKPVPGATTILKNCGWSSEVLVGWARSLALKGIDPFKVRDDAAEIGTVAHEMVEQHLGENYPDVIKPHVLNTDDHAPVLIEKAKLAFKAYLDWENGLKQFEPIESEVQLTHVEPDLLYGGTIDLVAEVNGVLRVIDFKTSKYVYPTHVMQGEAYRRMLIANFPEDYPEDTPMSILHMSKADGRFTCYNYESWQLEGAWEGFKYFLGAHYVRDLIPGG